MARISMLKPRIPTADVRRVRPPPKETDPLYGTAEYKRWQAAVIRRDGGVCRDPDCRGPHYPGQRVYADHVIEVKDGGAPFDVSNGITRCASSHTRKTARARGERAAARYQS